MKRVSIVTVAVLSLCLFIAISAMAVAVNAQVIIGDLSESFRVDTENEDGSIRYILIWYPDNNKLTLYSSYTYSTYNYFVDTGVVSVSWMGGHSIATYPDGTQYHFHRDGPQTVTNVGIEGYNEELCGLIAKFEAASRLTITEGSMRSLTRTLAILRGRLLEVPLISADSIEPFRVNTENEDGTMYYVGYKRDPSSNKLKISCSYNDTRYTYSVDSGAISVESIPGGNFVTIYPDGTQYSGGRHGYNPPTNVGIEGYNEQLCRMIAKLEAASRSTITEGSMRNLILMLTTVREAVLEISQDTDIRSTYEHWGNGNLKEEKIIYQTYICVDGERIMVKKDVKLNDYRTNGVLKRKSLYHMRFDPSTGEKQNTAMHRFCYDVDGKLWKERYYYYDCTTSRVIVNDTINYSYDEEGRLTNKEVIDKDDNLAEQAYRYYWGNGNLQLEKIRNYTYADVNGASVLCKKKVTEKDYRVNEMLKRESITTCIYDPQTGELVTRRLDRTCYDTAGNIWKRRVYEYNYQTGEVVRDYVLTYEYDDDGNRIDTTYENHLADESRLADEGYLDAQTQAAQQFSDKQTYGIYGSMADEPVNPIAK